MIKNLFVLLIILLILAGGLYFFSLNKSKINKNSVLGVAEKIKPVTNQDQNPQGISKKDINDILEKVKSGISEITSENVSSSSSKIDKIINDLKSLREKKALEFICEQVCKK